MTKKLLKNIQEYRQWAWQIVNEFDGKSAIEQAVGMNLIHDCYDYNDKNEPIDENGNVIPDDTAETAQLDDWVNELVFPVVAVYWIEREFDRVGEVMIIAAEFVSLSDFSEEIKVKIELGKKINFLLDGKVKGQGIVKATYSHTVEVELTSPCKEFDAGVMILVDHSEIVQLTGDY